MIYVNKPEKIQVPEHIDVDNNSYDDMVQEIDKLPLKANKSF